MNGARQTLKGAEKRGDEGVDADSHPLVVGDSKLSPRSGEQSDQVRELDAITVQGLCSADRSVEGVLGEFAFRDALALLFLEFFESNLPNRSLDRSQMGGDGSERR